MSCSFWHRRLLNASRCNKGRNPNLSRLSFQLFCRVSKMSAVQAPLFSATSRGDTFPPSPSRNKSGVDWRNQATNTRAMYDGVPSRVSWVRQVPAVLGGGWSCVMMAMLRYRMMCCKVEEATLTAGARGSSPAVQWRWRCRNRLEMAERMIGDLDTMSTWSCCAT